MFRDYWFWIFIVLSAIVAVFSNYQTKKLPPKQKELSRLFYSLVGFGMYVIFLTFFILLEDNASLYTSGKISSVEEVQKILVEQSASISNIKMTLYFFFVFLLITLLPAIYNFAKSLVPEDSEETFNRQIEKKKPILGLDNK